LQVLPNSAKTIAVTLEFNTSQDSNELWVYSGYINVVPNPSPLPVFSSSVSVPYQAIRGDPSAFQVLAGGDQAPLLVSYASLFSENTTFYTQPNETATFTFANDDVPFFYFTLLRPAQVIKVCLFKFSSKKFLGYIDYLNSFTPGFAISIWAPPGSRPAVMKDPVKMPGTWTDIPDGKYFAKITTRKYLGKGYADLTEEWTSPKIVVKTA
jgi:hypothetical protein